MHATCPNSLSSRGVRSTPWRSTTIQHHPEVDELRLVHSIGHCEGVPPIGGTTAAIHELEGVSEGVIVDGHVATLLAMTEMRTRSLPYPRQSGGLGLSSRNDSL